MKSLSSLAISALVVLAAPVWAQTGTGSSIVKCMTYNVRAPGWNPARAAQVIGTIDAQMPDILGLQEASVTGSGADILAAIQDDYEPHHANSADPIYLRRSRGFTVIGSGTTTLPVCTAVFFPTVNLNWVKVVTPEGAPLDFYNTHLCVSQTPSGMGDPAGNQAQAVMATQVMASNSDPGIAVFVGDLNANQNSPTIQYLRDGVPLTINGQTFANPVAFDDTWETAHPGQTRPGTTALGGMSALDWIFADPSAAVHDAEVISFTIPPGQQAGFSDHLPVTATIEIWPRGQANSAAARLEINGRGEGAVAGPFGVALDVAAPTLTLTWQGPANRTLALFVGAPNPAHLSIPGVGVLDIGTPPLYTDLVSIADGTLPGALNAQFVLDGSGSAQQTTTLLGVAVGPLAHLQGYVVQPAGSPVPLVLTAAFYLTVVP